MLITHPLPLHGGNILQNQQTFKKDQRFLHEKDPTFTIIATNFVQEQLKTRNLRQKNHRK